MDLLTLDGLALRPDGPTLTLGIRAGEVVAVMGPVRSGRTTLLRVCVGRERPTRGRASATVECILAGEGIGRRSRVSSVLKALDHPKANDTLVALGLWNVRNDPVADLVISHRAALDLLEPLLARPSILALDGQIDRLDPWAHAVAWEALRKALAQGSAAIVVTDRPETAALCDAVVVLRDRQVRFAGTPDALRRLASPHEFTVTTERQIGVRALVSPFEVRIEEMPEGLRMEAKEGQELAARLLREGYGDVKFLVSRAPTLEEGLQGL